MSLTNILEGLSTCYFCDEEELCQHISNSLLANGFSFTPQKQLSPKDRIDFLVSDGIGIEVKVKGSLADVTRQLHRYAKSTEIKELVLVTTRAIHMHLPGSLLDKPLHVVHLLSGFC